MTDDWTRDHDPANDWDTATADDDYVEEEPWAEEEWEDWKPPSRTGRKILVAFLILLAIVVAGGFVAWSQVKDRIDPPGPPGEAGGRPISTRTAATSGSVTDTADQSSPAPAYDGSGTVSSSLTPSVSRDGNEPVSTVMLRPAR